MTVSGRIACAFGISTVVGITLAAQTPPTPLFIYTHAAERARYLANAVIWRDPGPLTPDDIRRGPKAAIPDALVKAGDQPIECRYERPGTELGGKTPKFACRTADGKTVRVKYYGGDGGNREVFAELAAGRTMWALGFDADPTFPAVISCLDCPEDPWHGSGSRQTRRYFVSYEPHYDGIIITSTKDIDQGWTFGELDNAINGLPAGALRARQKMHFDALTLLAVFLQHGDRKRSQQRLVCRGQIDITKGDVHDVESDIKDISVPVLFEHPGEQACLGDSFVTIQDAGATLGGAGTFTKSSAKIHLKSWSGKKIFSGGCRGNMGVSGSAGSDAMGDPVISEAGRQFLATQFKRLTTEDVRAIFETAHVSELRDEGNVDGWVAAFLDKVRQIDEAHCGS
jgi:hypothetical protein